jgi:hypothetical protein
MPLVLLSSSAVLLDETAVGGSDAIHGRPGGHAGNPA